MMNSKLSKQLDLEDEGHGLSFWVGVVAFLVLAGWLVLIFAADPTGHNFLRWLLQ